MEGLVPQGCDNIGSNNNLIHLFDIWEYFSNYYSSYVLLFKQNINLINEEGGIQKQKVSDYNYPKIFTIFKTLV